MKTISFKCLANYSNLNTLSLQIILQIKHKLKMCN